MTKRKPVKMICDDTPLYSWSPDKRATRAHIVESIQYALAEKRLIATKSDAWYESACEVSRQWRDETRRKSVKQLARKHLEYWRMRAFLGLRNADEGGSYVPRGWPWDGHANAKWMGLAA